MLITFLNELKDVPLKLILESLNAFKSKNTYQNIDIILCSMIPYSLLKPDVSIILYRVNIFKS